MVKFQILDIGSDDYDFSYIITLYGKNKNNQNIVCNIKGFRPSFYVRLPDDHINSDKSKFRDILTNALEFSLSDIIQKDIEKKGIEHKDFKKFLMDDSFEEEDENSDEENDKKNISLTQTQDKYNKIFNGMLKNKMSFYTDPNNNNYCDMRIDKDNIYNHKSFYNFSFDEKETFKFYKLTFKTGFSMNKYVNAIKKYYNHNKSIIETLDKAKDEYLIKWLSLKENNCDCEANLYESKVNPILKFIHTTKINPCGWVNVDIDIDKKPVKNKKFLTDIQYDDIDYNKIKPCDNDSIKQFIICSFDIECDSSHGDFPNPKKDFKKLATEIYDFLIKKKMTSMNLVLSVFNSCVDQAFKNKINPKYVNDISEIHVFNKKFVNLDEINEMIRKNEYFKNSTFNDPKNRTKTINDLNKYLKCLKDSDGKYIEVEGDHVIQIGSVFYKYGEKEPYLRHIVVYKSGVDKEEDICSDLDEFNIVVDKCFTEKDLLLKWVETIQQQNPDYLTGYNIFGFDFSFIIDRVNILFPGDEKNKFYKLGKMISNEKNNNDYYSKRCKPVSKELSSSGLGDNELKFIQMDGRILFDMQKEIQKGHSLESYKLDSVSSHFMKGSLENMIMCKDNENNDYYYHYKTKNIGNLKKGDYINLSIHTKWGEYKYSVDGKVKKLYIQNIDYSDKTITIKNDKKINITDNDYKLEWCLAKDDISPQDIFNYQEKGTPEQRGLVAKYCIMDCELVIYLVLLLDIIPNNIGMANVCTVPQSYIFLRGQGIKITSLITKVCDKNNIRIPTLQAYDPNNKEGFEGAIVLDPEQRKTVGMYLDCPIAVVDYASLYPSSIIENNFSHETYICTKKDYYENPDKYNRFLENGSIEYTEATYDDYEFNEKLKKKDEVIIKSTGDIKIIINIEDSIDEEDNTKYYILENDDKKYTLEELTKNDEDKNWDKIKQESQTTCYYKSQFNNYDESKGPKYGIIPLALKELLDQRKATKKRMKSAETEDKKKVLDGLQLAYKVTANSVYGQMGARTSSIFFKKIAACTTAIGRQRIEDAEKGTLEWAESEYNTMIPKWVENKATIIYGDTDSVFIKFSKIGMDGKELTGKEAITHTIKCGELAGEYITKNLLNPAFRGKTYKGVPIEKTIFKAPQDLEYEKTFDNFILISKKRYIGDKYEFSVEETPKRTSMGIVMKRRDNAPIVKYVYGNLLEIIMKQKDLVKAQQWLENTLQEIIDEKQSLDMFIITKSLRGYYKNPQSIAHKVLADRIAERDPGNKPKSNDRIPYAYIKINEKDEKYEDGYFKSKKDKEGNLLKRYKKPLQGDRIEHKDYIVQHKLPLDYKFYISNQIMKPVKQLLDIQLDEKMTSDLFNKFIN